jgi:hypothetical protein
MRPSYKKPRLLARTDSMAAASMSSRKEKTSVGQRQLGLPGNEGGNYGPVRNES